MVAVVGPKWTIYCHTHIDSDRRYIGLTRQTWQARWDSHVSQALSRKGGWGHFQNAIRKYGPDAFSHEALATCWDLDGANHTEQQLIVQYDTRNPAKGFNLAKGGAHTPHPIKNPWDRPEYRAKNLPRLITATHTPQARANNKAALNTPESKAKRAALSKEKLSDPLTKEKMSAANSGRVFSLEHRAKLSVANHERDPKFLEVSIAKLRGRKLSPEHVSKTRNFKGQKHTSEAKAKISAFNKGKAPAALAIENSVNSRRERAASRTHFVCKVHGPIPIAECNRRSQKNSSFPRYECKKCKR